MKLQQIKFDKDMEEVTWSPNINPQSRTIKRDINDLYNWKKKISKKNEIERDQKYSESESKLNRIMSARLVDPNSELIASRTRNRGERIEDKLLRDGLKIKHKQLKMQEENLKASIVSCSSNRAISRLDYKKILYPCPTPDNDLNFDLRKISKIPSRQHVISKLFRSQGRY
jgi:hypothetical protein